MHVNWIPVLSALKRKPQTEDCGIYRWVEKLAYTPIAAAEPRKCNFFVNDISTISSSQKQCPKKIFEQVILEMMRGQAYSSANELWSCSVWDAIEQVVKAVNYISPSKVDSKPRIAIIHFMSQSIVRTNYDKKCTDET